MNYEAMWNELKSKIENSLKYYQSGMMQSVSESVHGESNCTTMLECMAEIEEKYRKVV